MKEIGLGRLLKSGRLIAAGANCQAIDTRGRIPFDYVQDPNIKQQLIIERDQYSSSLSTGPAMAKATPVLQPSKQMLKD